MDFLSQMREIDKHFKSISSEEFQENLKQAGYEEIEPSSYSGMKMVTEDQLKKENNYIYKLKPKNYHFRGYSTKTYRSMDLEVAAS
ncbi:MULTISPECIES: hypothetical protein [Bacillus]|uniref:hypothetical protein n=1 Tax=Bacillus TaxID=1386 RepID=UPI00077B0C6E|nr:MULTISPECIES: hypothetical protein [Bacillus cereus group]MCO4220283.1 hypothetical protein [Bacillus sp. 10017]MED3271517.1 hypothetical protein [Bacillus thuringiensis]KXY21801.1 hypothetical protein AT273_20535 [Bacillus cereus]MCO4220525.1 hypothetical protein [Bacillus sp. 10017]MCU5233917.1 hypothetical protein [Bacillus cereus]